MPQSLAQIYLHVVFSTKERRPFLVDPTMRDEMHRILGAECNNHKCPVLCVGGVADHVHILSRLGREIAISELVKEVKRESTLWAKRKWEGLGEFHWQSGYGAFSISPAHADALREYIANQEQHHRRESFQDEFRALLTKIRNGMGRAICLGLTREATPLGLEFDTGTFPGVGRLTAANPGL